MKIAMLEDEVNQAQQMQAYFSRYEQEHPGNSFSVTWYQDGLRLLDDYTCDHDVVFLDIQLPGITGMEVAHRIRAMDQNVTLIFITNLSGYAVEGYAVQAYDYILKPVDYHAFAAKLDRVLRALWVRSQDEKNILSLKIKEGFVRVKAASIRYLEVVNHDVFIHTGDETIKQWGTLSKFEKLLPETDFARCNACYLVNLKYVQGMKGDHVQVAGQVLAVSRAQRKPFLAALAQYKGSR